MKSFAVKLAVAIVVLLGGALFFGVGSGNAATFDLTNTNVNLPGLSILIRVTTGTDCTAPFDICVAYISSNLLNNPLGIDQFGYAAVGPVNGFPVVPPSDPPGWSSQDCPVGGCNMDGFGRFTNEADKPAANDLSFKLNIGPVLPDFAPNARGARFAAHIRFDQDCSLFVSDGTVEEQGAPGGCRVVPEPGAALLLGTGLAAILGGLRTRRWLIARA